MQCTAIAAPVAALPLISTNVQAADGVAQTQGIPQNSYADDAYARRKPVNNPARLHPLQVQIPSVPERSVTVDVVDSNLPVHLVDAQLGMGSAPPPANPPPVAPEQFTLAPVSAPTITKTSVRKPIQQTAPVNVAIAPPLSVPTRRPMVHLTSENVPPIVTMQVPQPAVMANAPPPQNTLPEDAFTAVAEGIESVVSAPIRWVRDHLDFSQSRQVSRSVTAPAAVAAPVSQLQPQPLSQAAPLQVAAPRPLPQEVRADMQQTAQLRADSMTATPVRKQATTHATIILDSGMLTSAPPKAFPVPAAVASAPVRSPFAPVKMYNPPATVASAAPPPQAQAVTVAPIIQTIDTSRRDTASQAVASQKVAPQEVASVASLAAIAPAAGGGVPVRLVAGAPPRQRIAFDDPAVAITPSLPVALPDPIPATPPPPAAPQFSAETQKIFDSIPSKMDSPKQTGAQRVDIEHQTPIPGLPMDDVVTESSDAMNIKVAMNRPPMDMQYEIGRAYNALIAGENTIAISLYEAALANDPNNLQALFGIGTAYHRAGQFDMARAYYAKVLRRDPDHRDALNNFLSLVAEESPDAALQKLEELREKNPDFSPIPAQIAYIYQKKGNLEAARDYMMKAIALAPENLTYRFNLAVLLDRQGAKDEAAAIYQGLMNAHLRGEPIPGDIRAIQERLTFIRSNRAG